jgi:hydrogenase nickel incorporation protein HypA/HybF
VELFAYIFPAVALYLEAQRLFAEIISEHSGTYKIINKDYNMHESGIALSLLEIIEQEALPYKGSKVTKVTLRIGKLSGVMPDALRFAFEALSVGGIAEGASLEIEEVPLTIRCNKCKKVSVADVPFMICPHCEGVEVEMIGGRELEIKQMEIEDGSESS